MCSCEHRVCADVSLPEGVRLLSVFLGADEYKDLMNQQRCSSSHATSTAVQPSQPQLDRCNNTEHVVGDITVSDCQSVSDSSFKDHSDRGTGTGGSGGSNDPLEIHLEGQTWYFRHQHHHIRLIALDKMQGCLH